METFRSVKDIKHGGETGEAGGEKVGTATTPKATLEKPNHEANVGRSECAGQTPHNVGVRECGDKKDSIDICFTDTTVYFDHLIKTTSPLA